MTKWDRCTAAVRIVGEELLQQFWRRHPDVKSWLATWRDQVRRETWATPSTVLQQHSNASIVGKDRVIFRVKGNRYRLIVKVFYPLRIVYIRWIGPHAEYDRINAKEV